MKNLILLSLLFSSSVTLAGEEEGSGTNPSSANASNQEQYILVCMPQSNEHEGNHCIVVEAETDQ